MTRKAEGLERTSKEFLFISVVWIDMIYMATELMLTLLRAFPAQRFIDQMFLPYLFPARRVVQLRADRVVREQTIRLLTMQRTATSPHQVGAARVRA